MPNMDDVIFKGKNEAGAYILERNGREMPVASAGLSPEDIALLDAMQPGEIFSKAEVAPAPPQVPIPQATPTPEEEAAASSFVEPLAVLPLSSSPAPVPEILPTPSPGPAYPTVKINKEQSIQDPLDEFISSGAVTDPRREFAAITALQKEANLPQFPELIPAPVSAPEVIKFSKMNRDRGTIDLYENGKLVDSKSAINPVTGQTLTKGDYRGILREYPEGSEAQIADIIKPKGKPTNIAPKPKVDTTPPEDKIVRASVQNPMDVGLNLKIKGVEDKLKTEQEIAEAEAVHRKSRADGVNQINLERLDAQEKFNTAYNKAFEEYNELTEKFKGAEIKDYWEDKNIISKVFASLMIGLGEYSRSRTGGSINPALAIIDSAIERNYQRQKANLLLKKDEMSNQLNLINALKNKNLTENEQKDAYIGIIKQGLAFKIEAIADKFKDPIMKADAKLLMGKLLETGAISKGNYALQQAQISKLYSDSKGIPVEQNKDVVTYKNDAYLVPTKDQPRLRKMIAAYKSFLQVTERWELIRDKVMADPTLRITNAEQPEVLKELMLSTLNEFVNAKGSQESDPALARFKKTIPNAYDIGFVTNALPEIINYFNMHLGNTLGTYTNIGKVGDMTTLPESNENQEGNFSDEEA